MRPVQSNFEDTIFAPVTAVDSAARAAVRISGPDAVKLSRFVTIFDLPAPAYGWRDGLLRIFRCPVRLLFMLAPRSYTGENVVEIHLPAGGVVFDALWEKLLSVRPDGCPVRPAQPGEFTRRAVLNGKMDLAQAEGLLGLVEAENRAEREAAFQVMTGSTGAVIRELCDEGWEIVSEIEATLDFSEQTEDDRTYTDLAGKLDAFAKKLKKAAEQMRPWSERGSGALRVVLAGPTGAGKSTLFNRLLETLEKMHPEKFEGGIPARAVVAAEPDTTRDPVTARLPPGVFPGVDFPCLLVDTAGVSLKPEKEKSAENGLLETFRRRAGLERRKAAVVLQVRDVTCSRPSADSAAEYNAFVIRVGNKIDLSPNAVAVGEALVSAATGEGVGELLERIAKYLRIDEEHSAGGPGLSARMLAEIRSAASCASEAAEIFGAESMMDAAATLLRRAVLHIEEALGARLVPTAAAEEILDRIFSRFCVGK